MICLSASANFVKSPIYDACIDILDDITLIHNKTFMMHIFDDLCKELPDFDTHLTIEFMIRQSHSVKKTKTKAVPLKMLIKELFTLADPNNQSSTEMLEKVTAIGIQAILDQKAHCVMKEDIYSVEIVT